MPLSNTVQISYDINASDTLDTIITILESLSLTYEVVEGETTSIKYYIPEQTKPLTIPDEECSDEEGKPDPLFSDK